MLLAAIVAASVAPLVAASVAASSSSSSNPHKVVKPLLLLTISYYLVFSIYIMSGPLVVQRQPHVYVCVLIIALRKYVSKFNAPLFAGEVYFFYVMAVAI